MTRGGDASDPLKRALRSGVLSPPLARGARLFTSVGFVFGLPGSTRPAAPYGGHLLRAQLDVRATNPRSLAPP